jgi:hypothetical protein
LWWQRRRRSRYICVSDLIAKQDGESFARGGVADNDVGLWAASFFFSPPFFFFVLPWKGERERERENRKKKLTIWFVRSFFICLSSSLFSSGTVKLSYEECKRTNTHKGHLFILRPVSLWENMLLPSCEKWRKEIFFH